MKVVTILCLFALIQIVPQSNLVCEPNEKMVVVTSVADLRCKPEFVSDELRGPAMTKEIGNQDSQVYYGDCILAENIEGSPEWMKVSVLGQKAWRNNQWVPYPGYILRANLMTVSEFPKYNIVLQNLWTPLFSDMDVKSLVLKDLALGTRLEAKKTQDEKNGADWWKILIDGNIVGYLKASDDIYEMAETVTETEDLLRDEIVKCARAFVANKVPYVWGGRSPFHPDLNRVTGMDCSALTQLTYLAKGLEIPRDAGPQCRAANELKNGDDLKKADLIFLIDDVKRMHVAHVFIYVGDERVIEVSGFRFNSIKDIDDPSINKRGIKISDCYAREVSIKYLLGVERYEIANGLTISKNGDCICLGSYFGPDSKIQKMRNIALGKNVVW